MVQTPVKSLTLESFLALPETKPASEYIDGKIVQKPMPQGEHSVIQFELGKAIDTIVRPSKVAMVFTELRCTFGDDAVVPIWLHFSGIEFRAKRTAELQMFS